MNGTCSQPVKRLVRVSTDRGEAADVQAARAYENGMAQAAHRAKGLCADVGGMGVQHPAQPCKQTDPRPMQPSSSTHISKCDAQISSQPSDNILCQIRACATAKGKEGVWAGCAHRSPPTWQKIPARPNSWRTPKYSVASSLYGTAAETPCGQHATAEGTTSAGWKCVD